MIYEFKTKKKKSFCPSRKGRGPFRLLNTRVHSYILLYVEKLPLQWYPGRRCRQNRMSYGHAPVNNTRPNRVRTISLLGEGGKVDFLNRRARSRCLGITRRDIEGEIKGAILCDIDNMLR